MAQLNLSSNPYTALMAEKRPKSILSSLKNMLHRDSEQPADSASKPSGSSRKKPSTPAAAKRAPAGDSVRDPDPGTAPADPAAAQETAPDAKSEKKKTPNQPWYRHRQRW